MTILLIALFSYFLTYFLPVLRREYRLENGDVLRETNIFLFASFGSTNEYFPTSSTVNYYFLSSSVVVSISFLILSVIFLSTNKDHPKFPLIGVLFSIVPIFHIYTLSNYRSVTQLIVLEIHSIYFLNSGCYLLLLANFSALLTYFIRIPKLNFESNNELLYPTI